MSEGYPRARRITLRSDFQRLLREGTRIRTDSLDVRYIVSPLGYARVGIIVPLHGHSAVERNRLKRRLREIARKALLPTLTVSDVVVQCPATAYLRSFAQLAGEMAAICKTVLRSENTQGLT